MNTVITSNIKNNSELRIYEYIEDFPYEPVIHNLDFTILGLTVDDPHYATGGVKQYATYSNESQELVVKKEFVYNANSVDITLTWYKTETGLDGEGNVIDLPGIVKTFTQPISNLKMARIKKANRERSIIYLEESARGTPVEPYVNALLKHYIQEVDMYILNHSPDFEEHVNNEVDEPYLTYLSIVVAAPDATYPTGKTVKDAILENITVQ